MVGVSGLSKGCRTCRKRRVKCDQRHPSCARCERGSFECEGFGRDLSFVSENSRAKRRSLKQEALRVKAFEGERCDQRIVSGGSNTARIWPVLSHAAFKTEIQISFTLAKLFAGDTRSIAWLVWGYNALEDNINSDALKALSGLYYGRAQHKASFENDGQVYYSKTLRGLSKAIGSHGGTSLDVLLAGMTALCYEMIASPTYAGPMLHAGGVGRLIELRGPERHRDIFELHILQTMRNSICIKAMLDRKRCFLEKEEWKRIPWSLHPEEKTMIQWVQDIMCDIAGLFEDYDALSASGISPKTYQLQFENLTNNINHHLKLLSDWRALWEQLYPGMCYEQESRFPQSPFPTVLYYRDLEAANGLMLYNALYIILSEMGIRLLGPDHHCQQAAIATATEPAFECTNPVLNLPGASLYAAAVEICRSVEFYSSPPHESAGAFFITFPLKKANDQLPVGSAEQGWLKAMMVNIATKSGFSFSTGVL